MPEFKTVRSLALYIRNEMDQYLGRELPKKFKDEFTSFCKDMNYRKKIFSGNDFAPGFKAVLREKRLELLRKVLQEEGFYEEEL